MSKITLPKPSFAASLALQIQSTEAVSFDYRTSVNEAGPAPLSCTIRAPWRSVIRAAGQRAIAGTVMASVRFCGCYQRTL
jgi:hypothetical protein